MQNVPKGPARRVIIPDEDGWIMLGVDLSKADARVVAGLSEDPDYIAVYEDPTHDPYFVIAALIYGLTYEQVVGDDAKYKVGKKLTHATHYGGTEKTIAVNCGMPLNEASRAYRAVHSAFPGIRAYIEWVEHEVRYKKVLYNIFGRRRIFLDIWSSQMAAQALAWIPASSVADYQHLALASAHRALPPPARVCREIHDAFVITLPPSLEDECRTVLANAFDITVPIKGRPTKIPYEIKVGVNWDEV